MHILISKYEEASGQKINYSKSEAVFSKHVPNSVREEIMSTLGVRSVDRHEKYLGLSTIIGRSKKTVFASLKERMWKKVQGWKERMLSRPGKEVLIKAVTQAIPTYMMRIFSIPQGIIDELHAIMARFWWGSTEDKRKIHWWAWSRLCQPKGVGGMGFRDLAVFNQALLAKQVWRMMTKPGTLLCRVLKARYFKHSTVLEARRGHDPSYTWRSLWAAKGLLLEGLKWRVGNGHTINVWSDSWLPRAATRGAPTLNLNADPLMTVAEFIDPTNCAWRHDVLSEFLTEEEVNLVYELPLADPLTVDQLFWWPNKNGIYTVKSGYWLGMSVTPPVTAMSDVLTENAYWNTIWQMHVPPKLAHFIWKVFTNTLPVKANLAQRHYCDDARCDGCGATVETTTYVLFDCPLATEVWQASSFCNLASSVPQFSCADKLVWPLKQVNASEQATLLTICWGLWNARNSRIFEEEPIATQAAILGLSRLVEDYRLYTASVDVCPRGSAAGHAGWTVPATGALKINTDATLFDNGEVGLGVVGRDVGVSVLHS